ncbi:MAG: ribosome recycling factor [Massiliimalia sp.]|jgi:ribosome recycling factor
MKELLNKSETKMQKCIAALETEYASIRAGRANPAVLDKIMVDYYGSPTPIQQVAAISVAEARVLVIQPWDMSCLRAIEKAIQTSDLGINPTNDGKVIRIVFPQLTEERRKEIVKEVHKLAEERKVTIRGIRRDTNEKLKAMKKESSVSEDEVKDGEKKIQDLTDKYCKNIDEVAKKKEKEIMAI